MKIYDFDKFQLEQKKYTGSSKKFSIKIDNTYYIVKESIKKDDQNDSQNGFNSSAINEYLCSHIFQLLGFKTQNTLLGHFTFPDDIKRLCVACEDFTDNELIGTEGLFLQEFESYVHDWNRVSKDYGFQKRHKNFEQQNYSFLDEIEEIFDNDLFLKKQPELKEMFYNIFVIDALINNSNRNYHNFGFMIPFRPSSNTENKIEFAPIYNNGESFYYYINDGDLLLKANILDEEIKKNDYPGSNICEFYKPPLNEKDDDTWKNQIDYYKYIHSFKNKNLNEVIIHMYPIIEEMMTKINALIDDIESSGVISNARVSTYKKILEERLNVIIEEPYLELKKIKGGESK